RRHAGRDAAGRQDGALAPDRDTSGTGQRRGRRGVPFSWRRPRTPHRGLRGGLVRRGEAPPPGRGWPTARPQAFGASARGRHWERGGAAEPFLVDRPHAEVHVVLRYRDGDGGDLADRYHVGPVGVGRGSPDDLV